VPVTILFKPFTAAKTVRKRIVVPASITSHTGLCISFTSFRKVCVSRADEIFSTSIGWSERARISKALLLSLFEEGKAISADIDAPEWKSVMGVKSLTQLFFVV
jgi:hypothetical protein